MYLMHVIPPAPVQLVGAEISGMEGIYSESEEERQKRESEAHDWILARYEPKMQRYQVRYTC